jgi:hypothetical protein
MMYESLEQCWSHPSIWIGDGDLDCRDGEGQNRYLGRSRE